MKRRVETGGLSVAELKVKARVLNQIASEAERDGDPRASRAREQHRAILELLKEAEKDTPAPAPAAADPSKPPPVVIGMKRVSLRVKRV
jgi:hypothetical protein